MTPRLVFWSCLMSLAACASSPPSQPAASTDPIPYTLDSGGVQLVGQSLRIDFGRTDHSTERAMNKLVGQPPVSREVCANGRPYVIWADGTQVYFSDGAFRGWAKQAPDGTVRQSGAVCT